MGTTLTGTTPQDTYDSLIKVTNNGPLSSTARYLSDGLGNDSVLALSTTSVGIGTTSPSGKLHVAGGDIFVGASYALKFSSTSYMTPENNVSGAEISTAGVFVLKTGSTPAERLRVDASGNVGIGTSLPSVKLDVESGIEGITAGFAGATYGVRIDNGGTFSTGASTIHGVNSTLTASYQPLRLNGSYTALCVSNTEVVRATANGLTFNGDTAAANALDDYEEGTWTATLTDGTTTKTASCSYTKIGRMVYLAGGISNAEDPSAFTGNVYITGVPFVPAFSVSLYGFNNYLTTASVFTPYLESNQVIRFYKVGAASADNVQMQGSDLDFYSDIYFAGQFTV